MDEQDNEIFDNAVEKAIKKRIDEKQDETYDDEPILYNEEKIDEKNLHNLKVKWMTIRFHVRALANPEQSVEAKRKLLQKASVGEGVLSGLAKLALPMMKAFFREMRDRD